MTRRRIKDLNRRDQPASARRNGGEETNSGEYENPSGVREESTDDSIRPKEVDLQQDSLEEEDDQHV